MDFAYASYYSVGGAPDAPLAPMNLTAVVIEINNADIIWDASEHADYYTLHRNGSTIAQLETPGYFDVELDYETTYVYTVTASNGAGDSPASDSASYR